MKSEKIEKNNALSLQLADDKIPGRFVVKLLTTNYKPNNKAQIAPLSTVLILAIILMIVIATYVWGKSILEDQEAQVTANYVQARLMDIKNSIMEVSQEGMNSTRIVNVDLPRGKLLVLNGSSCTSNRVSSNGIVYNFSYKNKLIDAQDWIIIDTRESNMSCVSSYDHSAGVLIGKHSLVANTYINTYMLWFRQIQDPTTSDKYQINITPGDVTATTGSSATVVIRHIGSVNVSGIIYTNVVVDFV